MEIEYEHIRKINAKLKHEKTEAFDSHTLFPHVFRQSSMPMYVFHFYITSAFSFLNKNYSYEENAMSRSIALLNQPRNYFDFF